jgi:hypothetical protein
VSNWQKAELVNDNFSIQSFQSGHGELLPRGQFMSNGPVCLEFSILAIRPSSNSCNSEVVDCLESDNEPSEI